MLLLILLILGIATAFSFFYYSNTAAETVTLQFLGQTGLLPLGWIPYLLVLLMVLIIGLWLLIKMFSVPTKLRHSGEIKAIRKSRESLDKGLLELQAGNFEAGEKALTSYIDGTPGDAIKYLAAANSARERGADDEAEQFLKKASDASTDAGNAVRITQAEMMLERGDFADAEALLLSLHRAEPKNSYVMSLLGDALEGTGNTDKLTNLARIMRSRKNISEETVQDMEHRAWTQMLSGSDTDNLERTWDTLPNAAKSDESIIGLYTRRLIDSSNHDRAESVLQKTLNSNFSESVAEVYGMLDNNNTDKQIEQAEKWLSQNPKSKTLPATIAKLAGRAKHWDKAKERMIQAVQLDATPNNLAELGEILEAMGDNDNARDCYHGAAALVRGQDPMDILGDLKKLGSRLGLSNAA